MKYFNINCTTNISCHSDFQVLSLCFYKDILFLFQGICTLLEHTEGISCCDMMYLGVSFVFCGFTFLYLMLCKNAVKLLAENTAAWKLKMSQSDAKKLN